MQLLLEFSRTTRVSAFDGLIQLDKEAGVDIGSTVDAPVTAVANGFDQQVLWSNEHGPIRPLAFQLQHLAKIVEVAGTVLDAGNALEMREPLECVRRERHF